MREIKFRHWCPESKYMTPFENIKLLQSDKTLEDALSPDAFNSVLMQYTGLTDNNNKEIYEGDILAKSGRKDWDLTNYVAYEVFFHDNDCCESSIGFQMNRNHYQGSLCGTNEYYKFTPKTVKNFEVIGNIYENPELLNE